MISGLTKRLVCLTTLALAATAGLAGAQAPITRFDKLQETPLSAVTPKGWLREFLARQATGITGHPEQMSFPYDKPWWNDTLQKDNVPEVFWWPYEQTAYWTDGALRLGYLLRDKTVLGRAHPSVANVLDHPQKNGRLGPNLFPIQWPIAVFFRALQAEYLETGDPRVLDALHKHFLTYSVKDVADGLRHVVNVEGLLWTYGYTGDRKLLDVAEAAYAESNRLKLGGELTMDMCLSPDPLDIHGVTHMEEAKLPTLLYSFTGKRKYLMAAVNVMRKVDRDHMLPDGVPSSSENLRGQSPLDSHESCDVTDYTWALGYLLMATGDASWADRIERAVFNAGPGAVSKDFRSVQYFSSPNQVIVTGESNHNEMFHGSTWMQYRPYHQVECCVGNINRFMPNYASRLWMRDPKGGLVAAMYAPSQETVGKLTVTEATDYPFSDTIKFTFKGSGSVPFSFRVPGWCPTATVRVNGEPNSKPLVPGTFVKLDEPVKAGDEVVLHFPMTARLEKWGAWGVIVERGPLLYAFAVPEKVTVDTKAYDNLGGKKSDFPSLDLRPNGPWNYALTVDADSFAKEAKVVASRVSGYPYDPASVPIVIKVPARLIRGWNLVDNRYTPPNPEAGKFECEGDTVTLTLVPYGSTRLRLAVFPVGK